MKLETKINGEVCVNCNYYKTELKGYCNLDKIGCGVFYSCPKYAKKTGEK